MTHLVALHEGTELAGDYAIERVLGAGGFGITYLASETKLARRVAIKEYFPVDFAARDGADDVCPRSQASKADYAWGLQRFLDEAKTLAKFRHPNIVAVHRYFEARKTGYIVLHYEDGANFKTWLKRLGRRPRQDELDRIVGPLLDALDCIHTADFLHRDIAPDNIIIRRDGTPVLIDFGSARGELAKHSKTVSALVKPGYSPYEQYATSGRQQGPWTDIYALGATLYHAISGQRPLEAPSRMIGDELKPLSAMGLTSYRPEFLHAIDWAMALDVAARPRAIGDWRTELSGVADPEKARKGIGVVARVDAVGVGSGALAARKQASDRRSRAAAERRGIVDEFRDGWRDAGARLAASAPPREAKAAVARKVKSPGAAPLPAGAAAPGPIAAPGANTPAAKAAPARLPARADVAPTPAPISAPPTPRKRARGKRWRSLAVKLLIGLAVAGGAVAVQNRYFQAPVADASSHGQPEP